MNRHEDATKAFEYTKVPKKILKPSALNEDKTLANYIVHLCKKFSTSMHKWNECFSKDASCCLKFQSFTREGNFDCSIVFSSAFERNFSKASNYEKSKISCLSAQNHIFRSNFCFSVLQALKPAPFCLFEFTKNFMSAQLFQRKKIIFWFATF